MRRHRLALLSLVYLAGCTAGPNPAQRRTPVVAAPAPPPTLVVPPAETDWRDIPLTPGTWRYAPAAVGSSASYGPADAPVLVMQCDPATRQVRLSVPGSTTPLTVRTSSATRTLAADGALAARDPFLDQIIFSRGRFSIERTGAPTLYIPAWAEPARVVEGCRG
jgi:hypothetical protein